MNSRILHTKIWKDEYFAELTPTEKLLFMYFITNERVNIIHCYEITEREIAFDTGIDRGMILKSKEKFQESGKLFFYKNYVFLKNANRYESYKGEKNESAKEKILSLFPSDVLDWFNRVINTPIDRDIDTPKKGSIYHKSEIINQKEGGVGETKTSKNSHTSCTPEELQEISNEMNLPIEIVRKKHQDILEMIQVGEFDKKKNKTVYFTLKRWLDLDMKRGYVRRNPGVISI